MFKKIMFPTDFSIASHKLFNCIPTFKDAMMEEVILVHIVDKRESGDKIFDRTSYAVEELTKYKSEFEKNGIKVKTIVRGGIPFIELNEIAKEEDVSLVVITSHGKSMIAKMLLGSVTEKFIYHCQKPVLIEKVAVFETCDQKECSEVICKNTFKNILFPTDWSPCANEVFNNIKGFKEIGTESITVLHVIDEMLLKYSTDKKAKEIEMAELDKVNAVQKELTALGFSVKPKLTIGNPFREIKRAAREPDITLVAMGVCGTSLIKEMTLGSTAERVAKHAFKPVLLLGSRG